MEKTKEELAAEKAAEEQAAKEAEEQAAAEREKNAPKVEMTEEKVQELIDKAYARGARNSKEGKERKQLEEELEELRKFRTDAEKAAKAGGQSDEQQAIEAKINELTKEWQEKLTDVTKQLDEEREGRKADKESNYREKLKSSVLAAASAAGAHDPEDVFILMERKGYFKRDDESGSWHILNPETGKIRIDVEERGDPLSLKKGVAEYVATNPHLKRGSGRTGSGQGGSGAGASDREVPAPAGLDVDNLKSGDVFTKRKELLAYLRGGGKASLGGRHNQG